MPEMYIFIGAIILVIIRGVLFNIGTIKERQKNNSINSQNKLPYISVIVPARNEEKNIHKCIKSIAENNYPKDKYEIIVIDDRSQDLTSEVIKGLFDDYSNLRLLQIKAETEELNLRGKPGALQAGIESSKGEIILMTDADCTVENNWIRTIANLYEDDSLGLVASFTYVKGRAVFQIFQSIEWVYMHILAAAGIGLHQPLGCFGNNLSVRKSDFIKVGGYRNIKFSVTEDLALLQEIFSLGRKVTHLCHADAKVSTLPVRSTSEYFRQHHRWAIGGLLLGWRATIFVLSTAALWLAVIMSIIISEPLLIIAALASRMMGDFSLIYPTLSVLKLDKLKKWILPADLFIIIVELIVPFLLLDTQIVWKGQVFKKN